MMAAGALPEPRRYILLGFVRLVLFFLIAIAYLSYMLPKHWSVGISMIESFRLRMQWGRLYLKMLGVQVKTKGQIPEGRVMIMANHRTYLDGAVVLVWQPASVVIKAEVARWPIMGSCGKATYSIFVDRKDPDSRRKTRDQVKTLLESGYSVAIFPEGTTTAKPGLSPFKPGIFQVAADGPFQVLPAAIEYRYDSDAWLGKDTFLPHFIRCFGKPKTRVVISFGPILQSSDPEDLRQQTHRWIEEELQKLQNDPFIHPERMPRLAEEPIRTTTLRSDKWA